MWNIKLTLGNIVILDGRATSVMAFNIIRAERANYVGVDLKRFDEQTANTVVDLLSDYINSVDETFECDNRDVLKWTLTRVDDAESTWKPHTSIAENSVYHSTVKRAAYDFASAVRGPVGSLPWNNIGDIFLATNAIGELMLTIRRKTDHEPEAAPPSERDIANAIAALYGIDTATDSMWFAAARSALQHIRPESEKA